MRRSAGVTSRAATADAARLARTRLIAKVRERILVSGRSIERVTMRAPALMSRTPGTHRSIDTLPGQEMRLQHHGPAGAARRWDGHGIAIGIGRAHGPHGGGAAGIGGRRG